MEKEAKRIFKKRDDEEGRAEGDDEEKWDNFALFCL